MSEEGSAVLRNDGSEEDDDDDDGGNWRVPPQRARCCTDAGSGTAESTAVTTLSKPRLSHSVRFSILLADVASDSALPSSRDLAVALTVRVAGATFVLDRAKERITVGSWSSATSPSTFGDALMEKFSRG